MSSLKTNNISNLNGTLTIPTDTAIDLIDNGTAKAWVNFNGTGTVAIRSAYNVTSITDNAATDYTINFTNAFSDVNYVISGSTTGPAASTYPLPVAAKRQTDMLTGSCRVWALTMASGGLGALTDGEVVNVVIYR